MKMKKYISLALAMMLSVSVFMMNSSESKAYYFEDGKLYNTYNEAREAMYNRGDEYYAKDKEWRHFNKEMWGANSSCSGLDEGYSSESAEILAIREGLEFPEEYTNEYLQLMLSNGWLTEFVDEFKMYHLLDANYQLPAGTVDKDAPLDKLDIDLTYVEINASSTKSLITHMETPLESVPSPHGADICILPKGAVLTVLGYIKVDRSFMYVVQTVDGVSGYVDPFATYRNDLALITNTETTPAQ